jgi:hypothetical protein
MVMNYSEVESKVREATNDDTWGPHGSLMSEIAKYTFTYEHFPEVMSMLWKRMLQEKKNWRRVYKVCSYKENIFIILKAHKRHIFSKCQCKIL